MIFEKEILADYQDLVNFTTAIIGCMSYNQIHRSNKATAKPIDFVNDAIIEFYESNPTIYDKEFLKKNIGRIMGREGYQLKKTFISDFDDWKEESISKPEIKPTYSDTEFHYAENVLNLGAYHTKIDERKFRTSVAYFILNDGRVVSHYLKGNSFKLLKPIYHRSGYIQYRMGNIDGKGFIMYAHRLVWDKYGSGLIPGMSVRHIDGDKTNNRIENLQQVTQLENMSLYWGKKIRQPKFRRVRGGKVGAPDGERHGKFKGYYWVGDERFSSAYEASRSTRLERKNLARWCKKGINGCWFQPV